MIDQKDEFIVPGGGYVPPVVIEQTMDASFEDWWEKHGQFCRSGGGDYEKTFAYRAWEASQKNIRVWGWVWKDRLHEDGCCYIPSYTPAQHVPRGELLALVDPADLNDPLGNTKWHSPEREDYRLLKNSTQEERSWPEDFSHENGNYHNTCCYCDRGFIGYKRRVICKVCDEEARGINE